MKILVCNDDGVFAPGLRALVHVLSEIAEVFVVAPDRNRSGASNSLTLTRPVRMKTLENNFISVEGTPTDCVHLALTGILEKQPDLVVSGVNEGANLGDDILYSGTVAAAMEGRYLGLSAIAGSLVGENFINYTVAAQVAKNLVLKLKEEPLPLQTILNVNVPDLKASELKGFEITRLGTRHSAEPTIKSKDPRGRPIYWVGPPGPEEDAGPGTDFCAVRHGYVSITPLQIDLTNYKVFGQLSGWLNQLHLE